MLGMSNCGSNRLDWLFVVGGAVEVEVEVEVAIAA